MTAATFILITVPLCALIPILLTYKAEEGFLKHSLVTTVTVFIWIPLTYFLGWIGYFSDLTTLPPKFFLLPPLMLISVIIFVRSAHGDLLAKKLSVYTLIGIQAFRIFPELFLSMSFKEGLAPIQMSYHGQNFDILVAITALIILVFNKRIPISENKLAVGFSIFGLGLLFNIIITAIVSMPTPLRLFMNEPANTFIASSPYIMLPLCFVALALWGHFLLIKKILK